MSAGPLTHEDRLRLLDEVTPEPQPRNGHAPPCDERVPGLGFIRLDALAARVDSTPPLGFLVAPVWPADGHGVLAAQAKAGKTWADLDLALSVASGGEWLDTFPVQRAGTVLVCLGEGGERKMLRRLRAIAAWKGLAAPEALPIHLLFRVPHLSSASQLERLAVDLDDHRPVLVIIDPLYLAARGAKGSDLYAMGAALEGVQQLCQQVGAALVVVHHWNKTGEGAGSDRMTGVGPQEWGRVLCSGAVLSKSTDPCTRTSTVNIAWSFEGDEIPDTTVRIRRRVWAERPDELDSPLHYELERLADDGPEPAAAAGEKGLRPAARRVLVALRSGPGPFVTGDLGDLVASDATGLGGLKKRTIQDALKALGEAGLAVHEVSPTGTRWKAAE